MTKIIRFVAVALLLCTCMPLLCACSQGHDKNVTCDDVIADYANLGNCKLEHWAAIGEENAVCCVKVTEEDGDYIYFTFYDTAEHAKEHATDYNVFVWFFGLFFGEHCWLRTGTVGCVCYEYMDGGLFVPFKQLINQQ